MDDDWIEGRRLPDGSLDEHDTHSEYERGFIDCWNRHVKSAADAVCGGREEAVSEDILMRCRCGWQGRQSELRTDDGCPHCGTAFKSYPVAHGIMRVSTMGEEAVSDGDLVERLRWPMMESVPGVAGNILRLADDRTKADMREAADEIERLREQFRQRGEVITALGHRIAELEARLDSQRVMLAAARQFINDWGPDESGEAMSLVCAVLARLDQELNRGSTSSSSV